MIYSYCEAKGSKYVNLFSATAGTATQRLSPKCSNVGLHLSADGYRKVAETIFKEAFLPFMNTLT
jgi:lysophospholipase L1-like esterase